MCGSDDECEDDGSTYHCSVEVAVNSSMLMLLTLCPLFKYT